MNILSGKRFTWGIVTASQPPLYLLSSSLGVEIKRQIRIKEETSIYFR